MNAPGRGDNRGEESATHILGRVARPIFLNLLLCQLGEHEVDVRMTQGAILRRVYVRSNVLILGDRDCGDTGERDVGL